ncbi:MAG: hypothetical protein EZS28_014440 [Streblomastix strix]|uniref:Uncharacterized protein n=1 Tax=Streblomastix strix TaxID=222440 RepID=A0A5J4W5W5_9EUKA|nr:MAG: hypothetical protein EZS28_014440 [Streblomastix strix]
MKFPNVVSLKGDLLSFIPFDDPDTQIKDEKYLSEAGIRIDDGWHVISTQTVLSLIPIGSNVEQYQIDTLMQIIQLKQKKKSLRRKFTIKENIKVIVDEDANKDQNEDENKEKLFPGGEKEDETDALINKMLAVENKDDKKKVQKDFDENGQDEPDQQTGKEGAETEVEEENELLQK